MTLVLWSGGCDSTLILYRHALTAAHASPVRALTIEHSCVCARVEQRAARKRILAWMKRRGLHVKAYTIQVKIPKDLASEPNGGLPQPVLWIPHGVIHLRHDENLHLGWLRGEDVWHYRYWVTQSFEMSKTLLDKTGELKFDLEWIKKQQVISEIKDAGLYRLCWWCEEPKRSGRACGRCTPCRTHDTALYELGRGAKIKISEKPRKKK